jgi:two-component system OmpR family response regulator
MKSHILAVDDTADVRQLLDIILKTAGFRVSLASNAEEMDSRLKAGDVDLIVLDYMMPGEDGLSVCRRLTAAGGPPIIMLSARGADGDRIRGLDLGADDYVAKPFNGDELVSRIRAVLRRRVARPEERTIRHDGWTLDKTLRTIESPNGKTLALTASEFAVLAVLLGRPGRAIRREAILDAMAPIHGFTTPRALDTLISRLRPKLNYIAPEPTEDQPVIETIYGVGYLFR